MKKKMVNWNNPKEVREHQKRYRERNKTKILKRQKEYRILNPEKMKEYHRKSKLKLRYGITPEKYNKMLKKQRGCCIVCGNRNGKRKLFIDYDHKTKKVRELLCNSCNLIIGISKEDINLLKKIIKYLEKHKLK